MNRDLLALLGSFERGADGIYSAQVPSSPDQAAERVLRERVAAQCYDDYMGAIAASHSVPVMDREIERFLTRMPANALILDIGGCWGWHWRKLARRPDVGVLVIDFVRANLLHAHKVLGPLVGTSVALMHADATNLPFQSDGFDGVWTVQTFQHIPDFAQACREASRVLRSGGLFVNHSLHATPFNRLIYRALGKTFHTEGLLADGSYYLHRASDQHRDVSAEIFAGAATDRYTECLFHPDLRLAFTGREFSLIGRFDAHLSHLPSIGRWIARQRSFEIVKGGVAHKTPVHVPADFT